MYLMAQRGVSIGAAIPSIKPRLYAAEFRFQEKRGGSRFAKSRQQAAGSFIPAALVLPWTIGTKIQEVLARVPGRSLCQ
jgi:hypothetical protein